MNKRTMGWTSKTRERLQGGLWIWGLSPKVEFGAVSRAAQWEREEESGKIGFGAGEFLVPEEQPSG